MGCLRTIGQVEPLIALCESSKALLLCLRVLAVSEGGELHSPTTVTDPSVFAFSPVGFASCISQLCSQVCARVALLCRLMRRFFYLQKCPHLSWAIFSFLAFISSNINTAVPAVSRLGLRGIFFYPLTFNLPEFLNFKWISCRQNIVRPCRFTQPDNLCLLSRMLRSLTFNVIISRVRFIIFITNVPSNVV